MYSISKVNFLSKWQVLSGCWLSFFIVRCCGFYVNRFDLRTFEMKTGHLQ